MSGSIKFKDPETGEWIYISGKNGKTAYEYAKDGGYTGTEEEFAAKMAADLPENATVNGETLIL